MVSGIYFFEVPDGSRRCRFDLPLHKPFCPLPRRGRIDPRPALAEHSSHAGEGEDFSLLCRGLSPPAPLQPRRKRHGVPGGLRCPQIHTGSGTVSGELGEWGQTICTEAGQNRQRRGKLSSGYRNLHGKPMPHGRSRRDARGGSPLQRITWNLPLPRRGRGSGGMGARKLSQSHVEQTASGTPDTEQQKKSFSPLDKRKEMIYNTCIPVWYENKPQP